ncbi:MAG: dipeptide ABC transporter ATP-binding protein [Acidimicrobiales bacterium]
MTEDVVSEEGTGAGRPLLDVSGLRVEFATVRGWIPVIEDVGFSVGPGETVGLVGESGCGKTVSALAVMGLLPPRAGRLAAGSVVFDGRELTELPPDAMRRVRGNDISMIFQEPMTSLNPVFTVGNQIAEAVRLHRGGSRRQAWDVAIEMLDLVGIPDATRRVRDYPHAFSGGMRQRAMIAMALACGPKLLIADEPTTALDVTIQAQVLELMRSLQQRLGMAILFVTHDLGVVADICDRVVVMYAGQVVEQASVTELFARPHHPYSDALLASMPQLGEPGSALPVIPGQVPLPGQVAVGCRFRPRCAHAADVCGERDIALTLAGTTTLPPEGLAVPGALARCARQTEIQLAGSRWKAVLPAFAAPAAAPPQAPLLELRGLTKEFPVTSGVLRRVIGHVRAVDEVDLVITPGETVGLVGESGSGKSTVARLALRLIEPSSGSIFLDGTDLTALGGDQLRQHRRGMQIVFQDPYSSLDPRATIGETVGEPLEVHEGLRGRQRDIRVAELLRQVGLGPHLLRRYPHEFSGGQRQRIAVARALALRPRLLICDEPVSSLDVSTQSQVINLLIDLQQELGLAYLFIAHDLSVVRHISDRIAVMYLGRIMEVGEAEQVYTRPRHPYTEALLSAIPVPDPVEQRRRHRIILQGDIPSPLNPPSGCRFQTRCPHAMDICREVVPAPFLTSDGTIVACHLHTEGPRLAGEPVTSLTSSSTATRDS